MKPRFKLFFLCLVIVSTTFLTTAFSANRVHRAGNVWINLTDYGYLGNTDRNGMIDPETPGIPAPQCEFPGGSRTQYLHHGGLWIGAMVQHEGYEEPRVSVAVDGWVNERQEMFPTPDSGIIERSNIEGATDYLGRDIYSPDAIATQEFLSEYSDTQAHPDSTGDDPVDGDHQPLGIRINQKSLVWESEGLADFVIIHYDIENIGELFLKNLYLGLFIDGDAGMADEQRNFEDDLSGSIQDWYYYLDRYDELDSNYTNLAYIADNDGRPCNVGAGNNFTAPGVTGVMLLYNGNPRIKTSFNWWTSNGDRDHDYGPCWIDDGATDDWTRDYGTPMGDIRKYFIMSNREIDYDMVYAASEDYIREHPQDFRDRHNPDDILESHDWYIPPEGGPNDWIQCLCSGSDARYLISWGPMGVFDHIDEAENRIYRLYPGESFSLTIGYVCADGFHDRDHPQENEVIDPDLFDFTSIQENVSRMREAFRQYFPLSVSKSPSLQPECALLLTSYPSPFNSSAVISFNSAFAGDVKLSIRDISGRLIRQRVETVPGAGEMEFRINGAGLSTGTYWLNIEQNGRVGSTRLVLVK